MIVVTRMILIVVDGGDFDCSSFRCGLGCGDGGRGDGDSGQCHVDRKGSKSQLIINLLFLLNKGVIFTFSTVCRQRAVTFFEIAQLNIFHRLPTSQLSQMKGVKGWR